jgi:serine/threonine protein kinase
MNFTLESPAYETLDGVALSLLKQMLVGNPQERITAGEALNHPYFSGLIEK